jgi:hypothetical protein
MIKRSGNFEATRNKGGKTLTCLYIRPRNRKVV